MFLVHSDRAGLTNLDNVTELECNGRYLNAYCIDGRSHPIASYESAAAAEDGFARLIERLVASGECIYVGGRT